MIKTAFVILHYQNIDITRSCIESILNMDEIEELRIAIVDNASPNGSGKTLKEEYVGNPYVEVILNDANLGFSRANNIGCEYARRAWNPSVYVVANNDIIFPKKDFGRRVYDIFVEEEFYVLGPDIYNTVRKVHQSPVAKDSPSLSAVNRTISLNAICLKTLFLCYPLMKRWYMHKDPSGDAVGYDIRQEDVMLQGACVIFSKIYMDEREKAFWPETNFFYEEAIFTNWCKKNGRKIVYEPSLVVHHYDGASTKQVRGKIKFQMKNILDSARIYRKVLIESQDD